MPSLDYDLHKLGWRAFQDLVAVILQQVLGQTFHTFADTNDGGRDGAFYGSWVTETHDTSPISQVTGDRNTVVQCKFSANSGTLSPSMLASEIDKAARLHGEGNCDAYLLLTNLRVTGSTETWLRRELASVGIVESMVLDGTWICQQISTDQTLRRYVPRVYGLGDLALILDERRLAQARALLSRLAGDLQTFVPTAAYRGAAVALADHGFVLLLGEPASGKSTIAAMLALSALDSWNSGVRRVDSGEELVAAWDPSDPDQLFWVDDAFGAVRHDQSLTDGWTRRMDQVMTAVRGGARVILTSRDYIYKEARPHLKEYAYPLLRENKVVVNVQTLTRHERRQMLYNHLKAGDQPGSRLNNWRPHLRAVAEVDPFQPEVARRLAQTAFVGSSPSLRSRDELIAYFEHPVQFLGDVLQQLDMGARAALACIYVSNGELGAPVRLEGTLSEAVEQLGAEQGETLQAFGRLEGTFIRRDANNIGDPVWQFRHPTISEGFAALIAEDLNAISILVDGLSEQAIYAQLDCGGEHGRARGTLARVPRALYERLAARIPVPAGDRSGSYSAGPYFLLYRCSDEFLRIWAAMHSSELPLLLSFRNYVQAFSAPRLLARLHSVGALPEQVRAASAAHLASLALNFDGGALEPPVSQLFNDAEWERLRSELRDEIVPRLIELIDESADGWDDDVTPETAFGGAKDAVAALQGMFGDEDGVASELSDADEYVRSAMSEAEANFPYAQTAASSLAPSESLPPAADDEARDVFEDVADGH